MATTDELRSRIDKMTQQLQALEGKERSEALKTARDLVKRFAFEPEELGLTSARRVAGKKAPAKRVRDERPAMYLEPKTGATWNGWGKPPGWMPKDKAKRVKYLIAQDAGARAAEPAAATEVSAKKTGAADAGKSKAVPAKKGPARKAAAKKAAAKKAVKVTAVKTGGQEAGAAAAGA